ncbi:MAG: hypothetical protein CENE_01625 [Candidatus Celerinatantimonas neptuna]|nr:MAG: hypothetical protein CENE_01625 [Candidatus Celerinatantimonas neptuna]
MFKNLFKKRSAGQLPLFSISHIVDDSLSQTRDQALKNIAQLVKQAGYVRSDERFCQDLLAREAMSSTGFKDGIATPHAKSPQVATAGIWVFRFNNPIDWDTMDNRPVKTAVALMIPDKGHNDDMLPLIAISKANMDPDFRKVLIEGHHESIDKAIRQAIGVDL